MVVNPLPNHPYIILDMVDTNLQQTTNTVTFDLISHNKNSAISVSSGNGEPRSKVIHIDRRIPSGSVFDIDDRTFQSSMPKTSHWSIAWSDLMMTMFVLFLSMFVYQMSHQEFLKPGAPEIIGGDTTDALQIFTTNRATLPLSPTVQGLPLIAAGTIRRVEPAPPEEYAQTLSQLDDQFPIVQSQEQQRPVTITEPVGRGNTKETSNEKIVLEPKPLIPVNQPASKERFQDIYKMGKGAVDNNNLSKFAAIDLIPDKTMRIILTGDLLFDTGESELSMNAQRSLQEVTSFLKNTPYMINIVGHTDNVPMLSYKYASNWELSVNRATTVARFLIDEIGMNPSQFVVSGYSSFRPMVPNTNAENRSKNRRVEIIVSKRLPDPLPLNS